ncbi:MAG: 16S rRNA (cytidine(1402)-2'-O)-methyltransferase [Pseudomonadota bacterium]
MSGTLFVVATPIGNLADLSTRAAEVLAQVDLIAAEDTRHTGRLLSHLMLRKPLFALHDHNEGEAAETLLNRLEAGENIALVSDAGTPLVSDPGYRLVDGAHGRGIPVSPLPGPSAAVAAMSAAGLPSDRFAFEGFLPNKSTARRQQLAALASESRTLVFFESRHRINDSVGYMVEAFGAGRCACIARELTKLHEQIERATLGDLHQALVAGDIDQRGEFVVVVEGSAGASDTNIDSDRLLLALADKLPARDVAKVAADVTGERRNALYARLLELTQPSQT